MFTSKFKVSITQMAYGARLHEPADFLLTFSLTTGKHRSTTPVTSRYQTTYELPTDVTYGMSH